MNEQNNISGLQEEKSSIPEVISQSGDVHKKKQGVLDRLASFFHKKTSNSLAKIPEVSSEVPLGAPQAPESSDIFSGTPIEEYSSPSVAQNSALSDSAPIVSEKIGETLGTTYANFDTGGIDFSNTNIGENIAGPTEDVSVGISSSLENLTPSPLPQEALAVEGTQPKKRQNYKEYFSRLFHKKKIPDSISSTGILEEKSHIESVPGEGVIIPEVISAGESSSQDAQPEEKLARFEQLLRQDAVYQSMIRGEDIKNLRFQLSVRYTLLMLAIFVVIAWVVNNRIIMFGFADFPLLARMRDVLFGILTGLFCITIWFGSSVWFSHRIIVWILRIIALVFFIVVLLGIYLPLWR